MYALSSGQWSIVSHLSHYKWRPTWEPLFNRLKPLSLEARRGVLTCVVFESLALATDIGVDDSWLKRFRLNFCELPLPATFDSFQNRAVTDLFPGYLDENRGQSPPQHFALN